MSALCNRRRLIARAASLLLCLASGAALAQLAPDGAADPDQSPQPDLYLQALQSIAEGRRNDASNELTRLTQKAPLHAAAWLDLALTQCSLGHSDEAERMFATIETRFDPSRAILELIANAREEGCNRWQALSSSTLSVARGVDQNVNQGATTARYVVDAPGGQYEFQLSDDFRPRHDQYTVLTGDYTRELTPNGSAGFFQFQARRNDHLREYDTASAFAGIESPWRLGRWSVRTTGSVGMVSLAGKLYQRQAQLQARVAPPLPLPSDLQLNLLAGVSYSDFMTLTNFNSITYELRGQLAWRKPSTYASASLGYLSDRAQAQRPGGDRSGWFANLLARHRFGNATSSELAYTHQTWNSRLPYSPGLIEQVRAQSTHVVRANVAYALTRNQLLQLEARVVRNRENISIFQYNSRQLQLSWQWQGP